MFLDIGFGYVVLVASVILSSIISLAKGLSAARTLVALLFASYIAILICFQVIPIPLTPYNPIGIDLPAYFFPGTYLVAIGKIYFESNRLVEFILIILRMIAVYVPLGALAPATFPRLRKAGCAACFIALFALSIEAVQYLEGTYAGGLYKRVAVDDALLAIIGGFIGFALYTAVQQLRAARIGYSSK